MKKNAMKLTSFAFITALALLLFQSCNKKDDFSTAEQVEEKEAVSQAISSIEYDINTEGELVNFSSLETFLDALEFLSDNPERFFTDEALIQWEEEEGFTSLRNLYAEIFNEIEHVKSESDYMELKQRYPNVSFNDDGPVLPVNGFILASVLNEEGNVIIDNALHHFTNEHQMIILDKSREKLELAKSTLTTDEEKGIYVLNLGSVTARERGACGIIRQDEQKSDGNSWGSKRVNITLELSRFASPTRNSNGQVVNWKHTVDYNGTMSSKRRTAWWKKNFDDNLSWGTGWGVMSSFYGSMAHGTTWSTTNTWQINYFFRCYPVVTTSSSALPVSSFSFTYNGNHLTNTSLNPDLVASDDCF